VGVSWRQPVEELFGTPVGVSVSGVTDQVGHVLGDAAWAVVGCMATVVEAREALLVVSGEPFVASFSADAIAGAQLGAAIEAEAIVGDEAGAGVHG